MNDYSKYTVVRLKEELKARGLPQTGLKAILITRLSEAVSLEEASVVPNAENFVENAPENNAPLIGTDGSSPKLNGSLTPDPGGPEELQNEGSEGTVEGDKIEDAPEEAQAPSSEAVIHEEGNNVQDTAGDKLFVTDLSTQELSPASEVPVERTAPHVDKVTAMTEVDESPSVAGAVATKSQSPETYLSQKDVPAIPLEATQTSANNDEVLEDSRKRKRRSQSPPPSTFDSSLKKVKALDGSPRVRLPEDIKEGPEPGKNTVGRIEHMENMEANERSSKDVHMQLEEQRDLTTTQEDSVTSLHKFEPGLEDVITKQSPVETSFMPVDSIQSPIKNSPSDTRFKNLFSAPVNHADLSPTEAVYTDIEDRDISPALHPATSALYIRNFMRPLQPQSLKTHLIALANRSNDSPSPEIITEFFLDSIKTHCLVQFTSVSAASRVRTALHDRVWPDERTRKPLYIDYIPEAKLKKWIEVEQNESGGRQQSAKRWEVVYEQEEDGVAAYLQEVDGSGFSRPSLFNKSGVEQKISMGPNSIQPKLQPMPAPKGDTGKGFKALDDLFKSTAAKPKLYYQPVAESIAHTRLERLAAGRGGGRSDEMRRFTFEEDSIVDKGPEFGSGWRGGSRARGGYTGGYGGRGGGGGFRGGRGDSWR